MFNPRILYNGQNENNPVSSGINAANAHQLSKYTPAVAIIIASNSRIALSSFPTLHCMLCVLRIMVVCLNLIAQSCCKMHEGTMTILNRKTDVGHV